MSILGYLFFLLCTAHHAMTGSLPTSREQMLQPIPHELYNTAVAVRDSSRPDHGAMESDIRMHIPYEIVSGSASGSLSHLFQVAPRYRRIHQYTQTSIAPFDLSRLTHDEIYSAAVELRRCVRPNRDILMQKLLLHLNDQLLNRRLRAKVQYALGCSYVLGGGLQRRNPLLGQLYFEAVSRQNDCPSLREQAMSELGRMHHATMSASTSSDSSQVSRRKLKRSYDGEADAVRLRLRREEDHVMHESHNSGTH